MDVDNRTGIAEITVFCAFSFLPVNSYVSVFDALLMSFDAPVRMNLSVKSCMTQAMITIRSAIF